MNHERMQQDLFALHDQELPADRRVVIEDHLAHCSGCRQVLEVWRYTSQTVFEPLRMEASAAFVHDVMRRVRHYRPDGAKWLRFMRWSYPIIAFSMGVCMLAFTYATNSTRVTMDTVLIGDSTNVSAQWYSDRLNEDQLLVPVVNQ